MTVEDFIGRQAAEFEKNIHDLKSFKTAIPAVTVAMQPGSGGYLIAQMVAKRLGFTLYSKNLLNSMANKADVKASVLDEIEKNRLSKIEDFFASILPEKDYVYPGDYFEQLKDTISNLAIIGKGVIVGRGANFIIPPEKRFSIHVVAPLEIRVRNVAFHFKVTLGKAKKRIVNREAKRKAFIKENFHKNIDDDMNYDLTINTARMDLETCVELVIGAIKGAQVNRGFQKASSYILRSKNGSV